MDLGNWDDDDFAPNGAGPSAIPNDIDDFFEFDNGEGDSEGNGNVSESELEPLEPGVRDLTGDRGVLLKLKTTEASKGDKPSEEEPYVELHFDGYLVTSGDRFDTSRDQNYTMTVKLDIPPIGKSTIIKGLERALKEVRAGDTATITIASKYAYGKEGHEDIPVDSDLRFEIEVIDVRATAKRKDTEDTSQNDLNRLEEIKREREIAQLRREEEEAMKEAEKKPKVDRVAALREKLAQKHTKGGKKGSKKKKK